MCTKWYYHWIDEQKYGSKSQAQKHYYSLIGVTKLDTWQGCDDLSLA
jgi:hypothetical protein